jgi:uncharacterized protein YutE (UPF0331/DUF86 family)
MKTEREGRPTVISNSLAMRLQEYLGFRHVVRSLYGYELDPERIDRLVNNYSTVWKQFEQEIQEFMTWLSELAANLESL